MKLTESPHTSTLIFDSFTEMVEASKANHTNSIVARHNCGDDWHGCSVAQSYTLANTGWAAGREAAEKITASLTDVLQASYAARPICSADVVGDCWDMGRVVNGEPECAMRWEDSEQIEHKVNGKIVRIGVNTFVSSGVSTEVIKMRGAHIVALVDCLEAAGYQVELLGIMAGNSTHDTYSTSPKCFISVPLKSVGETLQADQIAYALMHPSYFRRHMFACTPVAGVEGRRGAAFMFMPYDMMAADWETWGLDMYIPTARYDNDAWHNLSTARKWLLTRLKALGLNLTEVV